MFFFFLFFYFCFISFFFLVCLFFVLFCLFALCSFFFYKFQYLLELFLPYMVIRSSLGNKIVYINRVLLSNPVGSILSLHQYLKDIQYSRYDVYLMIRMFFFSLKKRAEVVVSCFKSQSKAKII